MTAQIPNWLLEMVGKNKAALRTQQAVQAQQGLDASALHTVCVEAKCPNRGECLNCGDATFMILGGICTRGCKFCAVTKQKPLPPDPSEPSKIADTIKQWHIRYAVLTSPTRDDLPDGGAGHFAAVIEAIRAADATVKTEPLIPDFCGNVTDLKTVLDAAPTVLAHNIETVPELYSGVRVGADYQRSLDLLSCSKKIAPHIFTKSGLMLGLGESEKQVKSTLQDLRNAGVDLITIGQYLAPSKKHHEVLRYAEPAEYQMWQEYALSIGFLGAACGPLVRSSYRAGALYQAAMLHQKLQKKI
ncbi:MAG: lipoyl synthase [Elusimicrobiaceae bacterium]|nr:lipoyl synthase [Elusimicrobiaceae bacterium]